MKKIFLFAIMLKVSICLAQSGTPPKTDTSENPFSEKSKLSTSADISNFFVNNNNSNSTNESYLRAFNYQDDTKGSRYLFDKWVKGSVTNQYGQRIESKSYLFNYDKVAGNFLLTPDSKTVIELNKDQISSCEITDGAVVYKFEKVDTLGKNVFCIDLTVQSTNYKLYKKITTKFEKANFTTNGISTSGHNYDLYTDKLTYFIYNTSTKRLKQVELKKKSIKEAFPQDQGKVDTFFSAHSDDTIDENFMTMLVDSIN